MRKIICDRCGAEITGDRIGYVAANWRAASDNSFLKENPYEHSDFCPVCMKHIVNVIDINIPFEIREAVIDEEEPKEAESDFDCANTEPEPVKKAPQKKSVDKGKVGALAAAGWSNVKIANEMNISSERVRQILKELEGQK